MFHQVHTLQLVGNVSDTELLMTDGSAAESQEAVFKMKVRKLEHELTLARVALGERENELKDLQDKLQENVKQREHYEKLATKLDEQLLRSNVGEGKDMAESEKVVDATDSTFSIDTEEGSESVLQVICGQRDRFRKRMLDREDANNGLKQQLKATQKALEETKVL